MFPSELISVVVLCRPGPGQLSRCLQSIIAQSVAPHEIVVLDSTAEPKNFEVCTRLASRGVRHVRELEMDRVSLLREGISKCKGEYLCFLEIDQFADPFYLEDALAILAIDKDIAVLSAENKDGIIVPWRNSLAVAQRNVKLTLDNLQPGSFLRRDSIDLSQENVALTVFTPLSGRHHLWHRYARFLSDQIWDHSRIKIVLMDTSQSEDFGRMVRSWISQCDYIETHYFEYVVGRKGLADEKRIDKRGAGRLDVLTDVRVAMAQIYNRLRRIVDSEYLLIIEDDIIPPLDVCPRLMGSFCKDTVSVSAPYRHRYEDGYVAWNADERILKGGQGVQTIKGNGFGCALLRTHTFRQAVFTASPECPDFDKAFYRRLSPQQIVKIDWSLECEHRSPIEMLPLAGQIDVQIPCDDFDEEYYLKSNPDVRQAVKKGCLRNGYEHYQKFGKSERRSARARSEINKTACMTIE